MDPKAIAYFAAGIGAGLTIIGGAADAACRRRHGRDARQ